MAAMRGRRVFGRLGTHLIFIGALIVITRGEVVKKAPVGGNVTLSVPHKDAPQEINWKKNGHKVVDMSLKPRLDLHFYILRDRANISQTDGSLTIRDLVKEDSGLYTAEVVLEDNTIFPNEVRLQVLDCPDRPTITNQSTELHIVLTCNSSAPDVTYQWRAEDGTVTTGPKYNESRPQEEVTLTCVVDNEACKNNASIIFPPVPGHGISGGIIALIIIVIIVVIGLIVMYFFRNHPKVQYIRSFFPCWKGGHRSDPKKPEEDLLLNKLKESDRLALNLISNGDCQRLRFRRIGTPTMAVTLEKPSEGLQKIAALHFTLNVKPEDQNAYTAEIHHLKKDPRDTSVKDEVVVGNLKFVDGALRLPVPCKNVTTVALRKGEDTLFEWTCDGLRLQAGNITLEPKTLTIHRLEEGCSGAYEVETFSPEGRFTRNVFKIEVVRQGKRSQDKIMKLVVVREVTSPENAPLEAEPIGDITFHPVGLGEVTWKKNGTVLDPKDKRCPIEKGTLTIRGAKPADNGDYTAQGGDRPLEQFNLRLRHEEHRVQANVSAVRSSPQQDNSQPPPSGPQ